MTDRKDGDFEGDNNASDVRPERPVIKVVHFDQIAMDIPYLKDLVGVKPGSDSPEERRALEWINQWFAVRGYVLTGVAKTHFTGRLASEMANVFVPPVEDVTKAAPMKPGEYREVPTDNGMRRLRRKLQRQLGVGFVIESWTRPSAFAKTSLTVQRLADGRRCAFDIESEVVTDATEFGLTPSIAEDIKLWFQGYPPTLITAHKDKGTARASPYSWSKAPPWAQVLVRCPGCPEELLWAEGGYDGAHAVSIKTASADSKVSAWVVPDCVLAPGTYEVVSRRPGTSYRDPRMYGALTTKTHTTRWQRIKEWLRGLYV